MNAARIITITSGNLICHILTYNMYKPDNSITSAPLGIEPNTSYMTNLTNTP